MKSILQWAVLLMVVVSGCATNASDRSILDRRSQRINDQVEFLKAAGEPYGSEGIPNVRWGRVGPWNN